MGWFERTFGVSCPANGVRGVAFTRDDKGWVGVGRAGDVSRRRNARGAAPEGGQGRADGSESPSASLSRSLSAPESGFEYECEYRFAEYEYDAERKWSTVVA